MTAATSANASADGHFFEIVPLEVSEQEYADLQQQATELSLDEAQSEWLENGAQNEASANKPSPQSFPSARWLGQTSKTARFPTDEWGRSRH